MKKILCLLLALTMAMALMACGTQSDSADTGTSGPVLDAAESTGDPGESVSDTTETPGEETTGEASEETTGEPAETETSTQPEEETEAPSQPPHDPDVDYSEAIIGTWTVDVQVISAESLGLPGMDTGLTLTLLMSFDQEGNAALRVDAETAAQMVADFEADLVEYMVDLLNAELESQGFSGSGAEEKFYEAYAMTILEYCQKAVSDLNLAESLNISSLRDEDTYYLDGNALHVGSNVMMIDIDGDVLYILSDENNAWRNLGFRYPVAMDRAE